MNGAAVQIDIPQFAVVAGFEKAAADHRDDGPAGHLGQPDLHLHADLGRKGEMRQREGRQPPRDAERQWQALDPGQFVQPQELRGAAGRRRSRRGPGNKMRMPAVRMISKLSDSDSILS
jgi:hypothetical protein